MKRKARRRRRLALGLIAVGVGVVAGLLVVGGTFDKAITELTLPLRHEDIIRQQSREKGVDASLIAAVIYSESKFVDQTSGAGARGPDADHPGSGRIHRQAERRAPRLR